MDDAYPSFDGEVPSGPHGSSLPPPPQSPPIAQFRSPRRVTQALQVLLSVSIIISAVSAASSLRAWSLFSSILRDPLSVEPAELDALDNREAVLGMLQPVMLILVGVGFIVWTFRCYRNLPALGATSRRFSEGWAIGAWLVPFLNLVRPKQIVDDIWRSCDPALDVVRARRASADWRDRPVAPLLHWWWGAYVMIGVVAVIAVLSGASGSATFSDSRRSALLLTAAELVEIVAGILAFVVVTKAAQRMDSRADQIRAQSDSVPDASEAAPWWLRRTWAPLLFASVVGAVMLIIGPWAFGRLDASAPTGTSAAFGAGSDGSGVLLADLREGDCANLPDGLMLASPETAPILAVQVVGCDSPHDLEVFGLKAYPQPSGTAYPGDEAVTVQGIGLCANGFEEYVGASWLVSGLDIFLIQPEDQAWRFGDRQLICMIRSLGTNQLTGSQHASGGALIDGQRSPWSLKVGECFNDPDELGGLVLETVDCRGPHDNQVYAVLDHPDVIGAPYPGDGAITAHAAQRCAVAFESAVSPDLAPTIDFGTYARPFDLAWDGGSRTVVCALWSRDGSRLEGSSLLDS